MYKRYLISVLLISLFIPTAQSQDTAGAEAISVGVVPQFDARVIHRIWTPILNQLETRTGLQFHLQGAPTIQEFEKAFLQGKYDMVYLNPYHMILASESQGYRPILRDTAHQLYGVLVVNREGKFNSIASLNNQTIAFPAPNALGASLQIRQELTDEFGLKFTPRYVRTHDSVYLNVLLDKVAAGGGVQKTMNQQPVEIRHLLKVIHKTKPVSPHPIAIHPRVSATDQEKIVNAMLELGGKDSGKALLSQVPIQTIGVATIQDYLELKSMALDRFYQKSQ